jgi:glutaredoxin
MHLKEFFYPVLLIHNMGRPSITYFFKSNCPYSRMARDTIDTQFGGCKVQAICVDDKAKEYKEILSEECGRTIHTFPQIFIDDEHIGGYRELQEIIDKRAKRNIRRTFP